MPSVVETWSRKLHVYHGLFFLFFVWLFCLSGVVLNHPQWRVAGFWNERQQSSSEWRISRPAETDDLPAAGNLMTQLHIRGEISGQVTHAAPGRFDFRVVRPGDIYEIKADLNEGLAGVSHTRVNGWGILNMLHSFTGVRRSDPTLSQNWGATGVWRFLMDALSAALAFMVLSGIYIWYQGGRCRRSGLLALAFGHLLLAGLVAGIF